ncbi:hypothetical protein IGB42_01188 [Andreprevotia sp. IGB-42]|uniref:hypothetical protein n=1 Tax=Andreprevotia sp. IGB-42 TaxID=2497473 RepID=UPI0013569D97|nr:hypothetical protein [Andreprevotia sp. IGB-42]KAF0814287.1 hypothetical protein IGB42_01188 [Andreprevotia sp. IGB-42]
MKAISIVAVVDVVGALANDTLTGNLYLLDNNKSNGSTDEGTDVLKTRVKKGDQLVWVVQTLECEAYASIAGIDVDSKFAEYIEPQQKTYQGTNVTYWSATIKKDLDVPVPYNLRFRLASRASDIATSSSPLLLGSAA